MKDDVELREQPPLPSLHLRDLKVISALGRGAKGVVFLVQTQGGELLALKAISRASVEKKKAGNDGSEYKRIWFERDVLRSFQHPLLPKLRGVVSTEKIVGYIIDYCAGGDLNALRKKQTEKMFSDDIIRFYAAELVLALEYLHGLGIVYRDLKPENVMIQENGHLMLIDFDLSTKLSPKSPEIHHQRPESRNQSRPKPKNTKKFPSFYMFCNSGISPEDLVHPAVQRTISRSDSVEKTNSFVGTEEYVAPEVIIGEGHDFSVDWWCLGVMLYEMLYGTTPFKGSNRKETFYRIISKPPDLVGEPTALRDLIGKLLEKDPRQRISAEEIKGHKFFRGVDWDSITQMPRPPYIPVAIADTEGNKEIEVESFVEGVFKVEQTNPAETDTVSKVKGIEEKKNTNKGVWLDGLNHPTQHEHFLVF
ncbi:PREDICTED: serine/threonine-protein kinase OXI1-like [Ipomoea nil]|uniref:serine/threonine-protein kinase OXI1-like n=1 Tax=Ipomoea nil TaxID=35883 RepID=UPI000900CA03|nr:PREDICTED: serine/threonine-protein kinase OXI1-like [Ipomoea nil]